jgi:hypothetical protein
VKLILLYHGKKCAEIYIMGSKTFRKQPVDAKKKTRRNRSNKTRRNLKNKGGANFRLRKEFYSKKRRGGMFGLFSKPAPVAAPAVVKPGVYCGKNCEQVANLSYAQSKNVAVAKNAKENCERQNSAPACKR